MRSIVISIVLAGLGLGLAGWEALPLYVHAVGVCGLVPLAVLVFLFPLMTGSSTRDGLLGTRADRESFRRDVAGDYTMQELSQLQAQEDANYVEHMRAFAQRTESYDSNGHIVWRDVVTDQHGNSHVTASGVYNPGYSMFDIPAVDEKPEIILGEAVEEHPFRYYTGQLKGGA